MRIYFLKIEIVSIYDSHILKGDTLDPKTDLEIEDKKKNPHG